MNYDKEYDVNGIVQFDAATELLKLIPTNAKRVLDVGCGSGRVTSRIQDYTSAEKLLAIDQSQQMIHEASLAYSHTSISFTHCPIESFNDGFQENGTAGFDLVTSNSSFQWFRDHTLALKNIRNSLSDKGRFVVQTPCRENWCPTIVNMIERFFSECHPELKPYHHFPCMHLEDVESYQQLFEENGFEVTDIYMKEFQYNLSPSDFVRVFKSGAYKVYSYQEWFTTELPKRYSTDLLTYVERFAKSQDQISITMPRVFASMVKAF
ncbi:class I SAM-dependent methyltransferase [Vibrio marisflavi]|uniref:Trans-aconitate 2-methyltransferase n=1 Tax=Vibrio marisflavi CECT 7928 TaxID=634439 RepID=A0ABM9A466_9VIBR|nr:methyltransferase domain-containing protein [Vibrio marisflavi]CAH0539621.1 Trans-aconitate 2-methyltransferase [Vibrio marisflavi CECT 7928]